jgi:hypothetical protein
MEHPHNQKGNLGYDGECEGGNYTLKMDVRIDKKWKTIQMIK